MDIWADAFDGVHEVERSEVLTVDQRLKVAEIKALLAVGHELAQIQDQGVNPEWSRRG